MFEVMCGRACVPGSPTAFSAGDRAQPLRVAAAVSLREPLEAIAKSFERETGSSVALTVGSSGQLLAQVRHGASIDVFISAGREQIETLLREKLTTEHAPVVIARNRLVLVVPKSSEPTISGFGDLASPKLKRLAIGDPATVPAGLYAKQVLAHLKIEQSVADRLVHGASVRQALDYVARGEVSAGLVYASDAQRERERVEVVATANEAWHTPIEYLAVMLATCNDPPRAQAWIARLTSRESQQQFQLFGLMPTSQDSSMLAPQGESAPGRPGPPPGSQPLDSDQLRAPRP